MKKKNKALHVWYVDTIDSKVASSIVYEYFNNYVSSINIYKFHKYNINDNIDFNIVKDNDTVVFVGLDILYNDILLHNLITDLVDRNKIIWIDRYDHSKVINNISLDLFKYMDFIGSEENSLSYKTYEFFRNILINSDRIHENSIIPGSIFSIDTYYKFEYYDAHLDEIKEDFVYGLFTENFTAKNFFRNIYNNLDIFKSSRDSEKIEEEYINRVAEKGKKIKNIANKYLVNKAYRSKNVFYIDDQINEVEYKCFACNSPLHIEYFIDIMKDEDILLTYYKDGDKWKYSMISKNNTIDTKYYADIFIDDEYCSIEKRIGDNLISSEFYTKYCIFDIGNKITIKPPIIPIFSKRIRIKCDNV